MSDPLREKLDELGRQFAARAPDQAQAVRDALDGGDLPELASLAHKLAGIAGMFGHQQIGEAARAVEEQIDEGADPAEATERLLGLLAAL